MSDVFAALGDPTRRVLLERLRRGGRALSLSDLADRLPMSRQAVTKHLDTLESAGLIERHMRGRERLHVLRGEPLREVGDWLAPYEAVWDERLARLRQYVEGDPGGGRGDGSTGGGRHDDDGGRG